MCVRCKKKKTIQHEHTKSVHVWGMNGFRSGETVNSKKLWKFYLAIDNRKISSTITNSDTPIKETP